MKIREKNEDIIYKIILDVLDSYFKEYDFPTYEVNIEFLRVKLKHIDILTQIYSSCY